MYSQKVPFWTGDDAASNTVILPALKALSAYTSPRRPLPGRWIRAKVSGREGWSPRTDSGDVDRRAFMHAPAQVP